jgi:hypothetical protein
MSEEFVEGGTPEGVPADPQQGNALPATESSEGEEKRGRGRPPKAKTESAPASEGGNTDAGNKPENQLAETPVVESPPVPLNPSGKVRIKHDGMAGNKIFLQRGDIGTFDNEGILEVEVIEAERLLTIPGYERA